AVQRGMVDPLFGHLDLLVTLVALRERKIISDGRAADVDAAQKGVALELDEVIVRERRREIIGGQIGAETALLGAIIDEIKEGDSFAVVLVLEIVAEGIGGEAE